MVACFGRGSPDCPSLTCSLSTQSHAPTDSEGGLELALTSSAKAVSVTHALHHTHMTPMIPVLMDCCYY